MVNKNELVKKYIIEQINKRIYSEGQMIESEMQLCEKLNLSRMTVRKALNELVNEGVVYKEKGRGTFVSRKPKYAEFKFGIGFTQDVTKRGMIPSTKDATIKLCSADEEIATNLNINLGEKVWKVSRVRCADGIPIIFVVEYYPYSLCPDLTIETVNQSIYKYLEEKGICFSFLDQRIEAVLSPKKVADKLEIIEGHPLILMSMIVYMRNGTVFNYGIEYCRTDKYRLVQSIYNKE